MIKHPSERAVEESTWVVPNVAQQLAIIAINCTPRWARKKLLLSNPSRPCRAGLPTWRRKSVTQVGHTEAGMARSRPAKVRSQTRRTNEVKVGQGRPHRSPPALRPCRTQPPKAASHCPDCTHAEQALAPVGRAVNVVLRPWVSPKPSLQLRKAKVIHTQVGA